MLERGIAYRRTQVVNWDPVDPDRARQRAGDRRTRLAHRGAVVEKREIPAIT